jgi:hypothetical protein
LYLKLQSDSNKSKMLILSQLYRLLVHLLHTLLYLPNRLEIRQDHSLLTPLTSERQFPPDTQLVARCKDQTDAMEGSHVVSCKDGECDHPLPWCSKTSDRLDFDGTNAVNTRNCSM